MTQSGQIGNDLRLVREAVERQEEARRGAGPIYFVWAAYTLIGYVLLDVHAAYANWFFLIGLIPAVLLSGFIGSRFVCNKGEYNRSQSRRKLLHWGLGSIMAVAAAVALANAGVVRARGAGQVCVVFFGFLYFLEGVYGDRSFLWLGPVLIVGGIFVGMVPHFGWSALGIVIAFGLCAAGIIGMRRISQARMEP